MHCRCCDIHSGEQSRPKSQRRQLRTATPSVATSYTSTSNVAMLASVVDHLTVSASCGAAAMAPLGAAATQLTVYVHEAETILGRSWHEATWRRWSRRATAAIVSAELVQAPSGGQVPCGRCHHALHCATSKSAPWYERAKPLACAGQK